MRVLLDESLPIDLARDLADIPVGTVRQERWTGLKNGALLRAAVSAGYSVLVTVDRQLEHQQNLLQIGIALVVLRAPSNRLADLQPLVPELLEILPRLVAGDVAHVGV